MIHSDAHELVGHFKECIVLVKVSRAFEHGGVVCLKVEFLHIVFFDLRKIVGW